MLQIGSKTFTEEGVTVFADHADPNQFWYLPAPVQIARRGPDDRAQFTLIKFKPAAVNAGVRGGGFLMIETELTLDKALKNKILSKCAPLSDGSPRLTVVPFDEGDVQCIALNLQGPGGTTATTSPGKITFVEKILGAAKPSLQGNNTAAFSLTLDQEGATLMERVFKEGGGPVGVIYQLKFTALRPSLDVEITADFKRIYDSLKIGVDFGAGFALGGVPIYLKAGLDFAFEKLKQDGAIEIKVINFSNSADAAEKERWALDFFKTNLLADWFKPTLPPVQFPSQASPGGINIPGVGNIPTNIPGLGGPSTPSDTPSGTSSGTPSGQPSGTPSGQPSGQPSGTPSGQPSGTPSGQPSGTPSDQPSGQPSGNPPGGGAPAGGTPGGGAPGGGAASGGGEPEARTTVALETGLPPAELTINSRQPATAPEEYRIELASPAPGPQETLTFHGGSVPPVVRINGTEAPLDAQRRLTRDLPAGGSLNISAVYPAAAAEEAHFWLYFDYEKPGAPGFAVVPPGPVYQSYVDNAPNPPDERFTISDGSLNPDGTSTQGGAAALRQWLQTQLGEPKQVIVDSHASFENEAKTAYNLQLTQRRRQVALGIIGSLAQVTGGTFHGHQVARAANRVRDPSDRVTLIRGQGRPGEGVELSATLSRAAAPGGGTPGGGTPGGGTPGGGTPGGGTPGGGTPGGDTPKTGTPTGGTGGQAGMGISLAFKLQKVKQEELKTVKLKYNRTEAVQQSYNPPGFLGLLTKDIGPGHFIEVDLDDPFFRTIDIVATAPISYDLIGLISAQMALDYGKPTDPVGVKHKDLTFDKSSPAEQKHSFSMNPARDTSFKLGVQYHFNPLSGWEGEKDSYDIPAKVTEDRTLLLNPFENFGFMELKIIPGDIDWSAVKSTEVHLRYEDPGIFIKEKIITLRQDSGEQTWKLRLTNPDRREISYFFKHHLIDGSVRQSQKATTRAATIAVDDSFDHALDLEFIPVYDTTAIRSVFAEFIYEDPAHSYKREERLEFTGDSPARQKLHIALFDPNVKQYKVVYTILGKDNSVRRLLPVGGSATLVFVGETF